MNMVVAFYNHLRPGGLVIVEDIDFNGYFTWPDSTAFRRFLDLYCAVVRKRGGDPNIGPRLPFLLADGGFEKVDLNIVQPMGAQGEVKLVNPITLECIADPILEDGLASPEEIEATVRKLYEFAANPRTLAGVARSYRLGGAAQVSTNLNGSLPGEQPFWAPLGGRTKPKDHGGGERSCELHVLALICDPAAQQQMPASTI